MRSLAVIAVLAATGGVVRAQPPGDRGPVVIRLSIEDAIRAIGRTSNPVGVARADVVRTRADVTAARSGYLPQVTVTGSYTRQIKSEYDQLFSAIGTQPGGTTDGTTDPNAVSTGGGFDFLTALPFAQKNIWNAGFVASQLIFDGGRVSSNVAVARNNAWISSLELTQTHAQAIYDVTQAYFNAKYAARVVAITEESLQLAERTLEQARLGYEQGVTAEYDVLRAEVTRDNTRTVLVRARRDREEAFLKLYQLLAIPYDQRVELTTPLFAIDVGDIAETARVTAEVPRRATERNGVTQARANVEIRRSQLDRAEAERWPEIAATTNYGKVDYPSTFWPDSNWLTNWTVGVNVVFPLFTGFRTTAQIQSARASVRAAEYQLREARTQAFVDSRRAELESEVARSTLVSTRRSVTLARRAYEIAELRYNQGLSTYVDLIDARLAFNRAQLDEAGASRDVAVSAVRLALLPALPIGVPVIAQTTGVGVTVTPQITPSVSPFGTATPVTPGGRALGNLPGVSNPSGAAVQLQ